MQVPCEPKCFQQATESSFGDVQIVDIIYIAAEIILILMIILATSSYFSSSARSVGAATDPAAGRKEAKYIVMDDSRIRSRNLDFITSLCVDFY